MGLAISLARISPRLPRFRPLSHRLRRRLVRVAARVGVCMRCRYPKGFGDHRCVLERIPYELVVNRQYFEMNK